VGVVVDEEEEEERVGKIEGYEGRINRVVGKRREIEFL